jgi:hypothetical protein
MLFPPGILLHPLRAVVSALFEPFLVKRNASIPALFLPLLVIVAVTWMVTVPIHELLHAIGCMLSGGTVSELTIQPLYGGAILEKIIPFVRAGGNYAGQLSDFDTYGSDLSYFVTVAFPYILTLLGGLPLLAVAARAGNPLAHGVGIVHTLLPLVSLGGDFYEMGAIVATRLSGLQPGSHEAQLIRGDDLLAVITRVGESGMAGGFTRVAAALVLGIVFIWLTWSCSLLCARAFVRKPLENTASAE